MAFFRLMDVTCEAAGCPPYLSQRYQDRHVYKPKRCVQICVNIIIFPVNLSNPIIKRSIDRKKGKSSFFDNEKLLLRVTTHFVCTVYGGTFIFDSSLHTLAYTSTL